MQRLNRKPTNSCWKKLENGSKQYLPTVLECIADLMASGRARTLPEALNDMEHVLLAKAKREHIEAAAERLPEGAREDFINLLEQTRNEAAAHLEFV